MKLVLTFMLTFIVVRGYAQQDTEVPLKENGISVTIGQTQFKDEDLHPKVFHGLTISSAFFHSRTGKNISAYKAGFKISAVNTDFEDFPSALSIQILADYRYLFNLVSTEKLKYYLGPVADMQYGINAYFNWDESHFHFANYLSGGIGNRVSFSSGSKSFDFCLDIPVISCIFRSEYNPQYKIDDMSFGGILANAARKPGLVLPDRNFYVKSGLEMKYHTKRNKSRSVGYNFRYHFMHAVSGNPYQNIENNITYKFIFQP